LAKEQTILSPSAFTNGELIMPKAKPKAKKTAKPKAKKPVKKPAKKAVKKTLPKKKIKVTEEE